MTNDTNTTDNTDVTSMPIAQLGDEVAAGYPHPMRDPLEPVNHGTVARLLNRRRQFWIDAAQGYLDQTQHGSPDALHDAAAALNASTYYVPRQHTEATK